MTYLDALRKLAQAATPGYWSKETHDFVRACSPERILAMLAVIEAAKAMRQNFPMSACAQFDAALAALERSDTDAIVDAMWGGGK